ncbi:GNAT family N-acetyltransferase [Kitasatospora sp. NPDC004240]
MVERLRPSTAELVRSWQPGWGLCRELGPAREVADGDALEVALGLPGRSREVFALRADEDPASVDRLAARVAGAGPDEPAWLTVVTRRPEAAGPLLASAGLALLGAPERMMTVRLAGHPAPAVPAPYRVQTRVRPARADGSGTVVECRVTHPDDDPDALPDGGTGDGTVGGSDDDGAAASGLMGVAGPYAVAHRIRTAPAHRRRGLASVVMAGLVREAAALGAAHGLLIASPEGERLYTSLGWTDRAAVLTARLAPPPDRG